MTIPTEVAAIIRDLRDPEFHAKFIPRLIADRIESALTKAVAVAPVPRDPVERYLFDALKQYPSKNPQRTQAAKICAGVLKMARQMAENDVENWQ